MKWRLKERSIVQLCAQEKKDVQLCSQKGQCVTLCVYFLHGAFSFSMQITIGVPHILYINRTSLAREQMIRLQL